MARRGLAVAFGRARQLVAMAAEAYRRGTVSDPRTDAQANITLDVDGNIIVAFKGSSEPADFVQDAKFEMCGLNQNGIGPAAKVHCGFLEDFSAIKEAVVSQVEALLPRGELFITGHSLGGALAMLFAPEFCARRLPVSGVYTFGQPRVGNSAFAAGYDRTVAMNGSTLKDLTMRVVNENDIVPRTPGWLLGYRHGGNELFLPAGTITEWELNPGPWSHAWSDLLGLYGAWRNRRDVLVSEHFLAAYRQRIQLMG
jgi:triacylglycerol lipase